MIPVAIHVVPPTNPHTYIYMQSKQISQNVNTFMCDFHQIQT